MGARHTLARWFGVPMRRYSPTLVVRYGYVAGECPDRDQAPCLQADAQGWTWTARVAPRLYQWTRLLVNDTRLPRDWRPAELQGLTPQGHTRGADVTWRIAARTAGPGFFLVGDAAAVLDPASSHGVLRAMMSGIMAAHLATLAIKQPQREPEVSAAYHAWLSDWFAHDVGMLKAAYMRAGMLCGG
jgi:2-polyprenyl-6-methoxyphenol hydroxylase-like FAD-dependent oxidoreductase